MNLNDDRAKEYYEGLRRKLADLEQLAAESKDLERFRLKGKVEGVKLAIQDFEYYHGKNV